ncbi:MAG: hypothetical protein ACREOG_04390, partial [Gemmatimonadaceae bacterium]
SAVRRFGAEVVGDSAVRATRDGNERRFSGVLLGTGAIIAGTISRRGTDSMRVRVSVRDMSEERVEQWDHVVPLRDPLAVLPNVMQRIAADLGRVNWGPKGAQNPPGGAGPEAAGPRIGPTAGRL